MTEPDAARSLLADAWADLGGDPDAADAVALSGPAAVLPSRYDVTGFATACAGAAAAALAELVAVRTGTPAPAAAVDRLAASASFRFEALIETHGWTLPPVWDPVAGDHRAADGWIRLHTNYRHHLDAVLAVLGVPADRDRVAAEVASWPADELESAVVAAGGAAAAQRTAAEWADHPAGAATAEERPVVLGGPVRVPSSAIGAIQSDLAAPRGAAPLAGIRVLDLTRVIAGPVATRLLAAYGADVLRIDPPGFDEVPALLPETTAGKRCAWLDLADEHGRATFARLVAEAHVVVGGLRPGALEALGWGPDGLRAVNPAIVILRHDAYGWSGPWAHRRGFDSLVQMSTGIAAAGAEVAGADHPVPLPAQALDHGVGHLLAAAACRALTRLAATGATADVQGSLVGASNVVRRTEAPEVDPAAGTVRAVPRVRVATAWGPMDHVPPAVAVAGHPARWALEAGPLGRHEPAFASGRSPSGGPSTAGLR